MHCSAGGSRVRLVGPEEETEWGLLADNSARGFKLNRRFFFALECVVVERDYSAACEHRSKPGVARTFQEEPPR